MSNHDIPSDVTLAAHRDALVAERDHLRAKVADLERELEWARTQWEGCGRVVRDLAAERDRIDAAIPAGVQGTWPVDRVANLIAERDRYRRDLAAMADRAAELAVQVTNVEAELAAVRAGWPQAVAGAAGAAT